MKAKISSCGIVLSFDLLKAFKRLSALFEERGESYAQAKARVSLESKHP